jgi:hypothetical protein
LEFFCVSTKKKYRKKELFAFVESAARRKKKKRQKKEKEEEKEKEKVGKKILPSLRNGRKGKRKGMGDFLNKK